MTERSFLPDYDLPSTWPNAVGELLATYVAAFQIRVRSLSPTLLEVPAGTDIAESAPNGRVAMAVGTKWRWIDATISSAGPGGAARLLDVYITASDNVFTPGSPGEIDNTDRSFALAIVEAAAAPTGAVLSRKVAVAQWDGAKFVSVTPTLGVARPSAGDLPIGAVTDYAGATDPSGTWLICDGRALSRATYASLFAAIGTTYGAGDGSTTFNIPPCRGRTRVGAGTGPGLTNRPLGSTFGEEGVSLTGAQVGPHAHSGSTGQEPESLDHSHFLPAWVLGSNGVSNWVRNVFRIFDGGVGGAGGQMLPDAGVVNVNQTTGAVGMSKHHHDFTTNTGDGVTGAAHDNMQPSIALNAIIRVL